MSELTDKQYTVFDLGYNKYLYKDDAFYDETPRLQSSITDGLDPGNLLSGGVTSQINVLDGYYQSSNYASGTTGWKLSPTDAEFYNVIISGTLTLTGGIIKYGKTSFTDSTNAGYFMSSDGVYFGSASDATKLKYSIATGTFEFIGNHSSGTIGGANVSDVAIIGTTTAEAVPTGLTCSSTGINTATDGTQSAYVILTWNAIATSTFDHYTIRYKKAANTYYTYLDSKANTITIEGLTPNVSYNFGVASANKYGTASAFSADISQTTASDTSAPATVSSVTATGGIQYVILEWTNNSETDLASYNVYRNTINDSGTATLIGNCRTNYFVDGGRTGGTALYYWVKAVDTSGNASASFSTVATATPRNVTDADIVTIAGSKVLIDGVVYLSNWQKSGDLTKIDGGQISANTITTTQLNFTPVQGSNVIASINSSVEGIRIDADNITISGSTTFSAGYDPSVKKRVFVAEPTTPYDVGDLWTDGSDLRRCSTARASGAYQAGDWTLATDYTDDTVANTKVKTFYQTSIPTSVSIGDFWIDSDDNNRLYRAEIAGADQITAGEWVAVPDNNKLGGTGSNAIGGAYSTSASGARVLIFPDANTGLQIIDDATNDVFKAVIAGTNVGDVTIGNYSGGEGVFYDKSANTFTFKGVLSAPSGTLGALTIESSGNIKLGQTGYNTGGSGFWLGDASGTTKFSLGNSADVTKQLLWDGTDLIINGTNILGQGFFGDGSDGDVTISGDTTLSRDMYYDNLTVNSGVTLYPNGWRIFCKTKLTNSGTISVKGGNASGTGSGGTPGAAGGGNGTLSAGKAGKAGGNGGNSSNNGGSGTAGDNVTNSATNKAGAAGGSGGSAPNFRYGGGGGAAGTVTSTVRNSVKNAFAAYLMSDTYGSTLASFNASAGSGSGGGGAGVDCDIYNGYGLGGGCSGGSGGQMTIFAREIINNASGVITAAGGNGSDGGSDPSTNAISCGGGGGGGGSGGLITLVYSKYTNSGTVTVAKGNKGLGGISYVHARCSYSNQSNGADGEDGLDGVLITLRQ